MISFGSASTDLDNVTPSGDNAAASAEKKERYKAMIEAVSQVLEDEFGKTVFVRIFYHTSAEAEALAGIEDSLDDHDTEGVRGVDSIPSGRSGNPCR